MLARKLFYCLQKQKKILMLTVLSLGMTINISIAASDVAKAELDKTKDISCREVKVEVPGTAIIPYPEGLDTTSSGASSVPREINHDDSIYFKANDYFTMGNTKDRLMIPHYPTYQQTTEYTCGPAAALTVLYYYGNHAYDEMSLAKIMKTNDKTGTSLLSMVKFFKGIGWNVRTGFGSAPFATYDVFKNLLRTP